MLEFIEDGHQYILNGSPVPSVTQCTSLLADYSAIPAGVLAAAAEFGTHVHLATELWDQGELVEEELDHALIPYLDAWKSFVLESGFVYSHIESRIFSKHLRYAGTLDRVGFMNGKTVIIDIKTPSVVHPSTGPQTAAYQFAHEEMTGEKIKGRYAVQLKGDGKYKLIPYTDKNDFNVFLCCLNIIKWRANHGK